MKKALIVLCAAAAFVGCDQQNRGGANTDRNETTGFGSSRELGGRMGGDTNGAYGSGRSSATTNGAVGAPGTGTQR